MKITWTELNEYVSSRLDKDSFMGLIVEHGYFAEQFPDCFSSKGLVEHLDVLLPLVSCAKNQMKSANATQPTDISAKKNDISRRVLSLPNPKAFLRLAKLMQENWDDIQNYANSGNSLSPITYLHSYFSKVEKVMLNSENIRESFDSNSDYIEGIRNCLQVSLGYKYRLKVDIANCYNSMYTHSIAWAICGKAEAKKYLRTKQPSSLKKKYELSDKLDVFIRHQKNNETNGVVIGPFTSRIFSEIILAAIDRKLEAKDFVFRRYVDDYKFYFRSEEEARGSIPKIERLLNEYGLHLNASKTEINEFPFEIISPIKKIYEAALDDGGVLGVLNCASLLHSKGTKGAYKYALKFIKDVTPCSKDFGVIISLLFNILLLDPTHGKRIVKYLKKYAYLSEWDEGVIAQIINKELAFAISDGLQQEMLIFLNIIIELKIKLSAENLINILKCPNDFAIVMALDIWKNFKDLIEGKRDPTIEIEETIETLSKELKGEQYSGARWFLLYEIRRHSLMDSSLMPSPGNDSFFDQMLKCGVTFYRR